MEKTQPAISPKFNYEPKFVTIHGSKMHYVEEGSGDPILFLHGNPTSSYLWRNIIPYLSPLGRCIAPDLIGMGRSDKPDLDYRFEDHVKYVEGFIEQLGLQNITLVIHDWGSGLGFHYAMRHPDNIKGLAFMEAIIRPAKWSQFPAEFKLGFKLMRTTGIGYLMINVLNVFIEQIMPRSTVRKLSEAEMEHYRRPFPNPSSRKPIRQWPKEIPIDGHPADMQRLVSAYSEKLQQSDIPKLLLYAQPGALITQPMVKWCQQNLPQLTAVDIGQGLHYVQEDQPHRIGEALVKWYRKLG